MVKLGLTNSRMKDFYDIYTFAKDMDFEGATLSEAIRQTFQRRQTQIPREAPLALAKSFFENKDKVAQWKALTKKAKLLGAVDLQNVCMKIEQFIMPPAVKAATEVNLEGRWSMQTGWMLDN